MKMQIDKIQNNIALEFKFSTCSIERLHENFHIDLNFFIKETV